MTRAELLERHKVLVNEYALVMCNLVRLKDINSNERNEWLDEERRLDREDRELRCKLRIHANDPAPAGKMKKVWDSPRQLKRFLQAKIEVLR